MRLILASYLLASAAATGALYDIHVESATRQTSNGDTVAYQLHYPSGTGPFATVVLNHGFQRSPANQAGNAQYLAQRGLVVMTPALESIGTAEGQQRAIANTVDHVRWLLARGASPSDPLFGRIDANRIALAGHSAGGAVALEATLAAQTENVGVHALAVLDGVPWNRTVATAPLLSRLPFSSIRSEPNICNANAAVLEMLQALSFVIRDVKLVAATHCDVENPTDLFCRAVCGGGSVVRQSLYTRLLYLFLRDTFNLPEPGDERLTYTTLLTTLSRSGNAEIAPVGGR
jgi:pimeloyl-ACP methyl ester carboxylesterase